MNRTKYGNIAIGQEGSIARYKADIEYLEEKLRLMEYAADNLRDNFVPNTERNPYIQAYNIAKRYNGDNGKLDIEKSIDWDVEDYEY